MNNENNYVDFDQDAFDYMLGHFPESKKAKQSDDRYLATCPSCGARNKFWWYEKMPHQGSCHACGYKLEKDGIKGVFALGYRSKDHKVKKMSDLSSIDNLVLKYRNTSDKRHRLSAKVIKEFGLFPVKLAKRDNSGFYFNIAFPFENNVGYIKHLNFSGRWISVEAKHRNGSGWLNADRIKPSEKKLFVLAGEWDLFSFWENTGIHGISPIDGEGTAGKLKANQFDIFSNKDVVIIFDNDKAGRRGAELLATSIQKYQKTDSIRIIDMSRMGLKGGGDIDDFFSSGGTIERLNQEINSTPEFTTIIEEEDIEAARIHEPFKRPESPDSILDPGTLDKIWKTLFVSENKRNIIFESIAESNGVFKDSSVTQFRNEIKKYRNELDTLQFLAYDILVKQKVDEFHIKHTARMNDFDSEKYFYYWNGYYNFFHESMMMKISDEIARTITSPDDRNQLSKTRKQATEDLRIAMLETPEVDFDEHIDYINFNNGIYDLKEKVLKKHSPEYNVTYKLPIEFNESADCPNFKEAIKSWFEKDEDQNELLKGLYYLISGDRSIETVFWFHGNGNDGKTQVANLCKSLVGRERTSAIAVEKIDDKHSSAMLFGKLLNVADEVPRKFVISDAMFKRMSGNSLMTGDPKWRDQITFISKALWVIPSNHFPNSSDTSHGYHRRFKIFRFRMIPKDKRIKNFFEVMLAPELPGIVNYLLTRGRELFEKDGFIVTDLEKKSSDEMKSKNSIFAYWQNAVEMKKQEEADIFEYERDKCLIDGKSQKEAEKIAMSVVKSKYISDGSFDSTDQTTILQKYNHRKKGDIIIVNTNAHYKFYKEFYEHDNVALVSYANFKQGTANFMLDHYKDIFYETEQIPIWTSDGMKKTNVYVLWLRPENK